MSRKPRVLLYSHDTYGLGHLRRSLAVAEQLARDIPRIHQLLVTGSMVAGAFGLPHRLDMIKLPALSKRSSGQYKARALPLSLRRTLAWREQMILEAVSNFKPHLVLVDKVAAGVHGELLPALRYIKTWLPETKLILGMRDIEDSPVATQAEWISNDIHALLDEVYDGLLLYGQREVFDPVTAYGLSPHAQAKLVECGYLRRASQPRPANAVRRELGLADAPTREPLVAVTVGGGGDGHDIIDAFLSMPSLVNGRAQHHSVVVTGPLMPLAKRRALRRAAQGKPVTFLEFTPDLISYLAAADVVISMAGYNTVCEILTHQKRSVLIPRVHVREEQTLRANRLAERGLTSVLHPHDLTPERLARAIQSALATMPPAVNLNLDGLRNVSQAISGFLDETTTRSLAPTPTLKESPA
jgi:predicted glycosyltransferase